MYFDDPQSAAHSRIYAGNEAQVGIEPIGSRGQASQSCGVDGFRWAALHQRELMQNWHGCHNAQPVARIKPLEWT